MTKYHACALALALLLVAATPAPKPPPHFVPRDMPTVPVHAVFNVEVNAKGQVVRVASGHATGNTYPFFNAQLYGNALNMWIRHPDGSAQVGLYRITYDYDPKTHKVRRGAPVLIKSGGAWANAPGAATVIVQDAEREKQEEEKRQAKSLPPLHAIVGPKASPTKKP